VDRNWRSSAGLFVASRVISYFSFMKSEEKWSEAIERLKELLAQTELIETVKWGIPVYTYNQKNVVGIAGFKEHFALWFYNGVFLSDPLHVLITASDGKTKALRQWRFRSIEEINEKELLNYVRESIRNEDLGKVWKPERSQDLEVPETLKNELVKSQELNNSFFALSSYKRKEFIEHITSAKREETQLSRLQKIIPMILSGRGLNDKYKNC
jgi:uncharacterized protein YdeI (YjbR/CyaY-like superfamily)